MFRVGEILRAGLKKAPAFAAFGAIAGATMGIGLVTVALPGIAAAFGMAPILGFGLVGAMGGTAAGGLVGGALGAAESFDEQRELSETQRRSGSMLDDQVTAPNLPQSQNSQGKMNKSDRRSAWNRD
jgi:hypothetical protein